MISKTTTKRLQALEAAQAPRRLLALFQDQQAPDRWHTTARAARGAGDPQAHLYSGADLEALAEDYQLIFVTYTDKVLP